MQRLQHTKTTISSGRPFNNEGQSIMSFSDDEDDDLDPFGFKKPDSGLKSEDNQTPPVESNAKHSHLTTNLISDLIIQIKPDTWSNIPVPVVKSFNQVCDILKVIEKKFQEISHIQVEKSTKSNNNMRKLEKALKEKEHNLIRELDKTNRATNEKMKKMFEQADLKIHLIDNRVEEMKQKMQSDREFIDTRLSRIDDSSVMKRWVSAQIATVSEQILKKIEEIENESKTLFDKIFQENLLVPDLIGFEAKFSNLRDYLGYFNQYVIKGLADLENTALSKIDNDVNELANQTYNKFEKIKMKFETDLSNSFSELQQKIQVQQDQSNQQLDQVNTMIVTLSEQINLSQDNIQTHIQELYKLNKTSKQVQELPKVIIEPPPKLNLDNSKSLQKLDTEQLDEIKKQLVDLQKKLEQSQRDKFQEIERERFEFEQQIKKQFDDVNKKMIGLNKVNLFQQDSEIGDQSKSEITPKVQIASKTKIKKSNENISHGRSISNVSPISLEKQESLMPENLLKEVEKLIENKFQTLEHKISQMGQSSPQHTGSVSRNLNSIAKGLNLKSELISGKRSPNAVPPVNSQNSKNDEMRKSLMQAQLFQQQQQRLKNVIPQGVNKQPIKKTNTINIASIQEQSQRTHILTLDDEHSEKQEYSQEILNESTLKRKGNINIIPVRPQSFGNRSSQSVISRTINPLQAKLQNHDQDGMSLDKIEDISPLNNSNTSRINKRYQHAESPKNKPRKSKLQDLTEKNMQIISKYQQDTNNSFKIPPILNAQSLGYNPATRNIAFQKVEHNSTRNQFHTTSTIGDESKNEVSRSFNNTINSLNKGGRTIYSNRQASNGKRKTGITPIAVKFESIDNSFEF